MRLIDMIPENDPLKGEKKDALRIARDLHYSNEVMERIVEAKNEIQIDNALKFGRGGGNDMKFRTTIKNGTNALVYC